MRIYSVRFNIYDGDALQQFNHPKKVSKIVNKEKFTIEVSKNGDFLVPEFDLQKYESYGNGYESVKIVGTLDDAYFLGISPKEVDNSLEVLNPVEPVQEKHSIPPIPNSPKLQRFEVRSVNSVGGKPLSIIEAKNDKEAWEIARATFPYLKNSFLSVRKQIHI